MGGLVLTKEQQAKIQFEIERNRRLTASMMGGFEAASKAVRERESKTCPQ